MVPSDKMLRHHRNAMLPALGLKTTVICPVTAFRLKWRAAVDPLLAEPLKLVDKWTTAMARNKKLEEHLAKHGLGPR